ncbi:MAG: HU family DNA-binding protein [Pseudomonadales bacterium]|nr:HU family DNA-binding protein [Pseudomonadales bacterium]
MPAKKKAAKKAATKKAAVKKTAAKKTAVRKAPAKKAAAAKAAPVKVTAVKEAMTKSQILNEIAESTELSRKQVQAVFDELGTLIHRHIKKRAVDQFTVPGLMKITVKSKPAQKARKGINPFTGEETMFKAKPASRQVKIRPLKKLKDMAES